MHQNGVENNLYCPSKSRRVEAPVPTPRYADTRYSPSKWAESNLAGLMAVLVMHYESTHTGSDRSLRDDLNVTLHAGHTLVLDRLEKKKA